ncbi:MAG: hypothetical protein QME78_11220 [Thermodesulfobacteriota bacterium]|nr:hypothetical protein [Thermodesulfobacteriota bacterium]
MELLAILKLIPVVLSVVEVIKRFIPDRQRTYANPIIAVVTGVMGAYTVGGIGEVTNVLMTGLLAGCGAIGAYKIPKEIGSSLGIN